MPHEPWSRLLLRGFYRVLTKGLLGFMQALLTTALQAAEVQVPEDVAGGLDCDDDMGCSYET